MAQEISEGAYFPQPADTRFLSGSNGLSRYRITALLVSTILAAFTFVAMYLVIHEQVAIPIALATLLSILLAALPRFSCVTFKGHRANASLPD